MRNSGSVIANSELSGCRGGADNGSKITGLIKNIGTLKKLYSGFEITAPLGNNAFSFDSRENKKIYVPALITAKISAVQTGSRVAFSEIEGGQEKNRCGLKNFIHYSVGQKNIFIFDNHNHAFFFWLAGYLAGEIIPGGKLIHIDQHSDMRKPQARLPFRLKDKFSLQDVFDYTNFVLNVGNFIQPALDLNLFSGVEIIDSSYAFGNPVPSGFVLDIDMDIFSEDMDYIDFNLKLGKIRKYIEKAGFITIATSPFFMEQQKAIDIIGRLL
ncbi:hypothetical protein DRI50_06320 [candidate division KSB1 bacterium]|nr:MAG: hypothetical protein DRI50_06320 [candidate division KSB1 bacterium]